MIYEIKGENFMATRRPNYSGSIRKVSDNKYVAEITVGLKENGKPNKKQFSAKTRAEVSKKLNDYKKTLNLGNPQQVRKKTVSEYFKFWLETKKQELKPASYRRIDSTFRTYIEPTIGRLQFATVQTQDIQKIINEYQSQKSYSTIKKIYDLINCIFKYDLALPPQQRTATFNPCTNVIIKRNDQLYTENIKTFSDDEISKIKDKINSKTKSGSYIHPYAKIYILILNTGMRIGEALALEKCDFDFEKRVLNISKNMIQIKENGYYQLIIQPTTKTSKSNRKIFLNDTAISVAKELFDIFPDTPYLILNKNGNRVSPQNADKTFRQILSSANIESNGRACHALRHTFATKLFEAKKDIKVISSMLGHSSVSITYDIYISIRQQIEAESFEDMPEI